MANEKNCPKRSEEKYFPPVLFLGQTMGAHRFYHDPLAVGRIQLDIEEGHHFVHVLRGRVGEPIELFDGLGGCAQGIVRQIKKSVVFVEIESIQKIPGRQNKRIILATAAAKGQRFDWMLSKCTELGVDHIALVQYERSVRLGKESAIERYQNLTIAACKQCGRNILPVITGPHKLDETITELKKRYPQSKLVFGSLEAGAQTVHSLSDNDKDVIVFVGPEGGLADSEIQILKHSGAVGLGVGSHILRTETASIVFAAILEAMRIHKI